MSLNNLAALLRKMSKVEQAEKLYMRSLSIREEALGPDHPQVCPHPMPLSPLHVLCCKCTINAVVTVCAPKLCQDVILSAGCKHAFCLAAVHTRVFHLGMFAIKQHEQSVDAACKALACMSACMVIKQLSSLLHFMHCRQNLNQQPLHT